MKTSSSTNLSNSSSKKQKIEANVRLSGDIRPIHYHIHMDVHLEPLFEFHGQEEIDLEVVTDSQPNEITLNAQELEIVNAFICFDGNEEKTKNIVHQPETQKVSFEFQHKLKKGHKYKLIIQFNGKLSDKLMGFYKSAYEKNGEKRYLAVTQMEPTDCRRVIPCWDEPSFKATFELSVTIPHDRIAISNMPITHEESQNNGRRFVQFQKSVKMSTYLLAIIVGEFDYLEDHTKEGVQMRVYTPPGRKHLGKFALDIATKALSFLASYFGIEYPLPKSDLICISDFAAGAMENWGAITYRETKLLIDPANSSISSQHGAARTICHELAHMWFGNLASPEWWTHLWLNEGFARYVEFVAVDHIFPDWHIWSTFNATVLGFALRTDSLINSHPIEVEVKDPAEINEIFDSISYAKGASVIRMLAAYLTHDVFLKGLKSYLKKFSYGNATTEDLWNSLQEASGISVKQLMTSWTQQTGYPVISVKEHLSQDKKHIVSFNIVQERFLSNGQKDSSIWKVPVTYMIEGDEKTYGFILEEKEFNYKLDTPIPAERWIKFNANQTGLYRVEYSRFLLSKFEQPLHNKALNSIDRLSLVEDAFALCKSGRMSISNLFSFLQNYRTEMDYHTWSKISENLGGYSSLFSKEDFLDDFKKYVRWFFQILWQKIGQHWNSASSHPEDQLMRSLCVARLGYADDPEIFQEAKKRFQSFVVERKADTLPPDFRFIVYKLIIQHGDKEEYYALKSLYETIDSAEEKIRCLQAICFTPNVELIKETLNYVLSDKVRSQDVAYPIDCLAMNPLGRDLVWKFIQEKWDHLEKIYGGGQFLLSSIVSAGTSKFSSYEKADEVEAFFTKHPSKDCKRSIEQSLERIRSNAKFLESNRKELATWLRSHEKQCL